MSSNEINIESYRQILSQVDETILKFKNNLLNENEETKKLSKPSSSSQIIESEKKIENNVSELQLENSNLKYENHYLKRQNKVLEESINKLKEQYDNLKKESNSFSERLNNINSMKEKNYVDQDEKYNNYINEIESQFEILKRDNYLLVERQKNIDDFLRSKKDLFSQLGIKINEDENEIIEISLFEELLNTLIRINQKISKELEMYKSQNKDLFDKLENALNTIKELNEKINNKDYSGIFNEQNNYMITNHSQVNINNKEEQRSFIKEDNINNYNYSQKPPTPKINNQNNINNNYYFSSPNYLERSKAINLNKLEEDNDNIDSCKSNIPINPKNKINNNYNSFLNQRQNRSFSNDSEQIKNRNFNFNKNINYNNNTFNRKNNNYNNGNINNNNNNNKRKNTPMKSEALEGLRARIAKLDEMLKQANFSITEISNNDLTNY